jgi:hypothetical protein
VLRGDVPEEFFEGAETESSLEGKHQSKRGVLDLTTSQLPSRPPRHARLAFELRRTQSRPVRQQRHSGRKMRAKARIWKVVVYRHGGQVSCRTCPIALNRDKLQTWHSSCAPERAVAPAFGQVQFG